MNNTEPESRELTSKERANFTHPAVLAAMNPPLVKLIEGKNQFECPYCGNGSGSDGTGVDITKLAKGYKYHCFKCGKNFDNIDIYADFHNLDVKKNLSTILDRMLGEIENVPPGAVPAYSEVEDAPKVIKDYTKQYSFAREKLQTFVDNQGGTWRGLTYETLKHFGVGFNPSWGNPNDELTPRVIIPWTANHFLARLIGDYSEEEQKRLKPKKHCGKKDVPFNFIAVMEGFFKKAQAQGICKNNVTYTSFEPVFIVEGEIDAMSIWQLTGYPVIAVGGKEIPKDMLNVFKQTFVGTPLCYVVLFDNDTVGQSSASKVADQLSTSLDNATVLTSFLGKAVDDTFLPLTFNGDVIKDANEGLQKCPAAVKESLSTIHTLAQNVQIARDEGATLADLEHNPQLNFVIGFGARKNFDDPAEFEQAASYFGVDTAEEIPPPTEGEDAAILPTTQSKIPSCPVDLFIPGGYGFDEFCVAQNRKPFTSTPIVITKIITEVESGLQFTELAFYTVATKQWHCNIVVPNDAIADGRKILQLSNHGVNISQKTAKDISAYLTELKGFWRNHERIPQAKIYKLPGWTDNKFSTFIYPLQHAEDIILKDEQKNYGEKFETRGSYDAWRKAVNYLYNMPDNGVFLLTFGVALAAPLVKIIGTRNLQLLLNCSSGRGKSAMAKIAMSIYGNPLELKSTFNCTANAIDELSPLFNCFPVWIDELQSASESVRRNFDDLIYNYAEGKPRVRLRRDGTIIARKISFNGSRIMTGEMPMLTDSSNAGAYNRLLSVSYDRIFPPDLNIGKIHRFFENNFGHFGFEWVKYLGEHAAEIKEEFTRSMDGVDTSALDILAISDVDEWQDNWSEFFVVLIIAWRHCIKLLMDNKDRFELSQKARNMLSSIKEDIPTAQMITNWQRAKVLLEDHINTHNKNFRIRIQRYNSEVYTRYENPNQPLQGFIDEACGVGIYRSVLTEIIERMGFPSASAIIREFAKVGLIEYNKDSKDKSHKYLKRMRLSGYGDNKLFWVYYFPSGALEITTPTYMPDETEIKD